jgi:hypothetical protein
MSGTKRTPIHRPSWHRPFTAEVLRIFAELEHGARRGQAFKAKERELMEMLNLDPPWLSGNSVLDRSAAPCWPRGYVAHETWHECRRLREALLAAIGRAA